MLVSKTQLFVRAGGVRGRRGEFTLLCGSNTNDRHDVPGRGESPPKVDQGNRPQAQVEGAETRPLDGTPNALHKAEVAELEESTRDDCGKARDRDIKAHN